MQIMTTSDPKAIQAACEALNRGDLVIFPTETCYGIAVDAINTEAVTRLLAYKGDRHRQVSIAVTDEKMANKYVELNDIAKSLYKNFLPGPITVISKSKHQTDERLESSEATLGVRIPKYDIALSLIKSFGKPITATSANTSGKKEPYSLSDWQKYTAENKKQMVALFLDGGKLEERPTSTVVDTTLNDPVVLRQGEIILPVNAQSRTSHTVEETQQIGAELLHKNLNLTHRFPLLIALQGDLGTGKTHLAKGFAKKLEIDANVSSPTYTLMREYPYTTAKYTGVLYHIDTWRLSNMSELDTTLNLNQLLKPHNIVVIEWAGKAKNYLETHKNDCAILLVDIKEIDENIRQIKYSLSTPEWT